jgi:RimJ/RimL family protein N-acetyltransferase
VVGRHCESGDVLAREVPLPAEPEPGDLLAFAGTGAYTYSMASNYNRVGRPAVVAVREGGSRVWLRREEETDLDRLEVGRVAPAAVAVPEGVVVRPATPRDAKAFLELYRSVAAEGRFIRTERVAGTVGEVRRRFRRSWTRREASIVAAAGGEVIGSLVIHREEHPVIRHVATFGMHVAPGWRGKGVGTALVAEAIRWAREMQVEKLELSVYPGNASAISLYRRFGFVQEGRLFRHSKKSYGYEDEILMGVWLEAGE